MIGPITQQSQTSLDALTGDAQCGTSLALVPTNSMGQPEQGRCGVGPRLPMLVISPYAKQNFVDNTFTTQSSVVRFIEDNWLGGERLGNGAADATAGALNNMFTFTGGQRAPALFLNNNGVPIF